MLPTRDDATYVEHIMEAIEQIQSYVSEMDFTAFQADRKTQDAVIRQLAIIGEASAKLSKAFRERFSGVPWADIVGMRNILIHEYFAVDIGEVWETVQRDLRQLKDVLRRT